MSYNHRDITKIKQRVPLVSDLSNLLVYNEYKKLRKVMVGPADTMPPLESRINAIQEHYFRTDPPKLDLLIREHARFVEVLKSKGIEVVYAKNILGCDQRDIRDIGIILNSTLLVCRVKGIRECEVAGLDEFLESLDKGKVIRCEEGIIEGGDLIIDEDKLYVGIGQRTNRVGYELIHENFKQEFEIIPIEINENYSHLDTVFNIISKGLAIVYPQGLNSDTLNCIKKQYQLIEVTKEEQFQLATNLLALSPEEIIIDANRNPRIANKLTKLGFKVVNIDFSETNKIGGSFRCGTLPLYRDR